MNQTDRNHAVERIMHRIDATLAQSDEGFPHYANPADGQWVRTPVGDWTGGFWVGMLWLAALHTNQSRYRDAARTWATRLAPRATSKSVFKGFLFWYGAGLGEKFFDDAVARTLCESGILGLIDMYNPAAGLIGLGAEAEEASNTGLDEANIDALPGTTALLLGSGAGSHAYKLGLSHVRKHIELCVRQDGSVCQSASFDSSTGALTRRYTHKGFGSDSTWARAQAWCLIGLAQAIARGAEEFRPIAIEVGDWWIEHVPADRIAYWDFDDDAIPHTHRDTSASAIAAAALLKLSALIPARRAIFSEVAEQTLAQLTTRYLTPIAGDASDQREVGILTQGCFNKRDGVAMEHELIWGDYFLLESLMALSGELSSEQI